ncbi:MAG: DUF3598 domain-containing protein [Pseudomonadota bacterium]
MSKSLKEQLPVLARHEGVWDGYYRYYNLAGEKTDEHRSRLLCRFPDDNTYHQTNLYFWADGKTEVRDFPTKVEGGRMIFYTDIDGWAADEPLDTHKRTVLLNWSRRDDPSIFLYEMIQISDCGKHRARVWQWFRDNKLFQRTLVDEQRISDDWAGYDDKQFSYADIAAFD